MPGVDSDSWAICGKVSIAHTQIALDRLVGSIRAYMFTMSAQASDPVAARSTCTYAGLLAPTTPSGVPAPVSDRNATSSAHANPAGMRVSNQPLNAGASESSSLGTLKNPVSFLASN